MAFAVIGLASLFFLGHSLRWVFIKTKVPDLLILTVLGYLLGPVLGILDQGDFGKVGAVLATLALIVILYSGGLELSAKELLTSSLPALGISIVAFFGTTAAVALLAVAFFQVSITTALLMGLCVGSTSSAIVIPMVRYLSITSTSKTILSLESAFTDVLAIVMFLVILDAALSGHFQTAALVQGVGPNSLWAVLLGISMGLVWAFVRKRFPEVGHKIFAGEAWALLTYGCIDVLGLNGALGVFALGFTLGNPNLFPKTIRQFVSDQPLAKQELSLLQELSFVLRTFFFVYLGLLIHFASIKTILFALITALLILVIRYFSVQLLFRPAKYSRLDAMIITAMGPRGLACAVLATLPLQKGYADGALLQNAVFGVIPVTIFFTALFVMLSENAGFRKRAARYFGAYTEAPCEDALPAHSASSSENEPANKSTNLPS
jgi:potassium/hydrogen antiporter